MEAKKLGRFELRRRLGGSGREGMGGDVYLAYDPQRGHEVALKLFPLSASADELRAEERGASLQRQFHPAVPAVAEVYEIAATDGYFYISMEYVPGVDLSVVLQQGAAPEARSVQIAAQLCEIVVGLQTAAQTSTEPMGGFVHGDIKPENIRLQPDDRVRLLDFGTAKALSPSRNYTENLFGTLPYISPERLAQGVVDLSSDLWAIGVVLYRMVVGRLPFPEPSIDALQQRFRRGGLPDRPPDDRCSPALRSVLLRCLAIDPARRYQTAEDLRRDLEAVLAGRPVSRPPATDRDATRRLERPPAPPAPAGPDAPIDGWPTGASAGRPPGGVPPVPPGISRSQVPPLGPLRRRRLLRRLVAALLVLAVPISVSQGLILRESGEVRSRLAPGTDLQGLVGLSERLRRVLPFDFLGFAADSRRVLTSSLTQAAEPVLARYRMGLATTGADWQQAAALLGEAAALDGENDTLRAKLAYSRGQQDRIQAEESFATDRDHAEEGWLRAVQRFREAARWTPELADPYVAMAQVYGDERYAPFEIAQLETAVKEAERRRFQCGLRETLALIKGNFRDGMTHLGRGRERIQDQEGIRDLYQARDRFEKARFFCGQVVGSRGTADPCAAAESALQVVVGLLQKMNQI